MSRRSLLTIAQAATVPAMIALVLHFSAPTPRANAARPAPAGGSTSEATFTVTPGSPTFTATPCPTDKAPDTFHGSGCGTITPTPTSQHPYPCGTPGAPTPTNAPAGPTATATPTGTPCRYPAPKPEIVLTVNGNQSWVNVVQGTTATVAWVLSNRGTGTFSATVHAKPFDGLDGECQLAPGESCTMSAGVTFNLAAKQIGGGVAVRAAGLPAGGVTYVSASVRITVAPLGDFDCDGSTDSLDAFWILQLSAGIILQISNTCFSDVNGDGGVNAIDALLILQFDAGLFPHFV